MQLGSMFINNCNSVIAVINKHTAKLHHVGSLYILTYDARKIKHKIQNKLNNNRRFNICYGSEKKSCI
jgi:hypothetical protein